MIPLFISFGGLIALMVFFAVYVVILEEQRDKLKSSNSSMERELQLLYNDNERLERKIMLIKKANSFLLKKIKQVKER